MQLSAVQGLIRHFRPLMEERIGRAADRIEEEYKQRIAA